MGPAQAEPYKFKWIFRGLELISLNMGLTQAWKIQSGPSICHHKKPQPNQDKEK